MSIFQNALAARKQGFDAVGEFRSTMGQNRAGNALAAGDTQGAANALYSTGQLDAGEIVQQRQESRQDRATQRQYVAEDRQVEAEDRQTAQQAEQAKMRGMAMIKAAEALKGVAPGQRAEALNTRVAPMMQRLGIDTSVFQGLSEDDLSDQGLGLFISQVERNLEVVKGSDGSYTVLDMDNNARPIQPKSPEATYDLIVQAASDKGGANAQRLEALRKSLQPEEWNDLSATVIQSMGKPNASAADLGPFSISGFVTKYEALSPRGKTLLFGGGEERKALDNLAQVASALKDVERAANSSKSGVAVQTVGTVAGLANPSTAGATALSLAAMTATGEAMTNPAFVRWLAQNARAARAGRQLQLSTLQALTARDPNLARIYQEGLALLPRAAGATGVPQRGGSVVVENLDRPDLALGVSSR
jgi:hypothetical protein